MSASKVNSAIGEPKYYDPSEVDAYVSDATKTIRALNARLLEATRRADEAERALGDAQTETGSLGRALLLASDVADKAIVEADAKAAGIVRAAEDRASLIVATAETEARQRIELARETAAALFRCGEDRLLAAVRAFVEGSTILRDEMAGVAKDATSWRETPPPPVATQRPPYQAPRGSPVTNGGSHPFT